MNDIQLLINPNKLFLQAIIQCDDDDDGDDLPSPGRNFPGIFLPTGELFSLSVFRPAEAAVSISDAPPLT
jgi:hypothetical protein